MWILESDGDLLDGMSYSQIYLRHRSRLAGKRVWLKPGKKYLFGRIKQDGGMQDPFLPKEKDPYQA
jgi:hypothetical protein